MVSQARQRLSDDHRAVDEVLKQLLTALNRKDVQASQLKLDLLWARLAVHIRAEHLHLFPAVLSRLTKPLDAVAPDSSEAQSIVENLRADHDFFMHELARAIAVLRELPNEIDSPDAESRLTSVLDAVREIGQRLASHNELEEKQIYLWASTTLTRAEQTQLATEINRELENRPSRFSLEAWANE